MAGYALALKLALAGGQPMQIVQLQDPRLSPNLFDALLVPRHDRVRAPNVLVTTGSLNRLTLASIHSDDGDAVTLVGCAARRSR